MADLPTLVFEFATRYGYFGVFAASLLGSVIPFIPFPYLIVVVPLSEVLDPAMLGIVAGVGGSLGKVTSYALGRSGYRLFKAGTRRKMDALRSLVGRYGDIGIFVFALTPLPDDIYFIPIGMMRFSFWRFLLANTAGKVFLSIFVALLGRAYSDVLELLLGEAQVVTVTGAVVTSIAVTIILLRVDWELALQAVEKRGWRGFFSSLPSILSLRKSKR